VHSGPIDAATAAAIDAMHILPDTMEMDVGGLTVRVLSIDRLIAVKEKVGRPKDQWALLILRAARDEAQKI
jgi:hypothetical protein